MHMLRKFFHLLLNWIYLLWNYFSSYVYQVYIFAYTKLGKELSRKNSICIKVNNFAKSINFKISRESSRRKMLKLSKLEYYSLCKEVNFIVKHPTPVSIFSFWRTMFGSSKMIYKTLFFWRTRFCKSLEKVTF